MIQAASRDETKDVDLKELQDIVNIRSGVKFGVLCIARCFILVDSISRFVASTLDKVEQGFISHNEVLPSDISLDITTEVRKLKTNAAIILSVSAASPMFN